MGERAQRQSEYLPSRRAGWSGFVRGDDGWQTRLNVEKCYLRKNEVFWTRLTLSLVATQMDSHPILSAWSKTSMTKTQSALRNPRRSLDTDNAARCGSDDFDRHIAINQRAARLTGYTQEEIGQVDPSLLAVEEDRS
jgi:PAS domain-containing protein